MPAFDSTGPIEATVELIAGELTVTAGDGPGTTVEVRPADPAADKDVRAAEQTRIEYADGRLLVRAPKPAAFGVFGRPGHLDVEITLAAGSKLSADGGILTVRCTGALGPCRVKTGVGEIRLDRTGPARLRTGAGRLTVEVADGDADLSTGSGELNVGAVTGIARLRNANGDIVVGAAERNLRARSANGNVHIGRSAADVDASTANGDIRVREAHAGSAELKTAMGEIEVGVPEGVAAYLDLHTSFGTVHNRLAAGGPPADGERRVEIHAKTMHGDILVRRP